MSKIRKCRDGCHLWDGYFGIAPPRRPSRAGPPKCTLSTLPCTYAYRFRSALPGLCTASGSGLIHLPSPGLSHRLPKYVSPVPTSSSLPVNAYASRNPPQRSNFRSLSRLPKPVSVIFSTSSLVALSMTIDAPPRWSGHLEEHVQRLPVDGRRVRLEAHLREAGAAGGGVDDRLRVRRRQSAGARVGHAAELEGAEDVGVDGGRAVGGPLGPRAVVAVVVAVGRVELRRRRRRRQPRRVVVRRAGRAVPAADALTRRPTSSQP